MNSDQIGWKDRAFFSLSDYMERKFLPSCYTGIQCHCHYFWYALSTKSLEGVNLGKLSQPLTSDNQDKTIPII